MKLSYYPGCSLHGSAREYDWAIQDVMQKLSIELVEVPDWVCCGASPAHMTDHELSVQLSAHNLQAAQGAGLDVMAPCPACFQRLRGADLELKQTQPPGTQSELQILTLTELLSRPEILDKIRTTVTRPLEGLKVACYYGCLSMRPPKVTGAAEYEHPRGLDEIVSALGGEPVRWSHKTECCSGSLSVAKPDIARTLVGEVVDAAEHGGAQAVVTDCPMCQANLESRQRGGKGGRSKQKAVPVFYITELVATAQGRPWKRKYRRKHLINPRKVLGPLAKV